MRHTYLFITLFILFTLIGVVMIAYGYLFLVIQDTRAQTTDLMAGEVLQMRLADVTRGQFVLLRDTEKDRIRLDEYIVDEEGVVEFLELLEDIEDQAGVSVSVHAISTEEIPTSITSVALPLELLDIIFYIEGEFKDIYHALALVESLPYASSLEDAVITAQPRGLLWSAELHVRVPQRTN